MIAVLFGAKAQIVVGVLMCVLTLVQWAYWTIFGASITAVFHISMEALLFASYAVVATGLGYRKTEHVEAQVAEIDTAEQVNIQGEK